MTKDKMKRKPKPGEDICNVRNNRQRIIPSRICKELPWSNKKNTNCPTEKWAKATKKQFMMEEIQKPENA